MEISETVLIFVVVPVAILAVAGGLAYAGEARRGSLRYRPGRPYEFAPVWFLSAPELVTGQAAGLTAGGHEAAALPAGGPPAVPVPQGTTGGASDRW